MNMDVEVVLQSSIQDLDSAVSPLASDTITMDVSDEKCAHPSDLPSAVDVGQSDNGNPEHLWSVAVNGAIGNEGYSGMDCSKQTDEGKFIAVDFDGSSVSS